MGCTTLLVGKNVSYDGSTIIARNEDSFLGAFNPKSFIYVKPEDQPRHYVSTLAHFEIDLPDDPMGYTAIPNAVLDEGLWSHGGINTANVAMTATETLTTNERVRGADPFVEYKPATETEPEQIGGIGEEDMVTLVLPYIKSAREGVERLGSLLGEYGTYEMNGIAFSDEDEIWWLETVGGHHWIAAKVPDDMVVIMPNQLGIDFFDLNDALEDKDEFMCSPDLKEFLEENHLDLTLRPSDPAEDPEEGIFNPREAFGSHGEVDHLYNTPRAWDIGRTLAPNTYDWYGATEDDWYDVDSDDIPWAIYPERKVTVEDVKDVLSLHFQGTDYDPYAIFGDDSVRGSLRPIAINRNGVLSVMQIRPYMPDELKGIQWVTYGPNQYNALIPFYARVEDTPDYMKTTGKISTDSFYWMNRLLAVTADPVHSEVIGDVEHYQQAMEAEGHSILKKYDKLAGGEDCALRMEANQAMADFAEKETSAILDKTLFAATTHMKNKYDRTDG